MTDVSHQANLIVEAVRSAMYDVSEAAKSPAPTPFQRAVIGGLVMIANHCAPGDHNSFTQQELGAAQRAIAPYLDESERKP